MATAISTARPMPRRNPDAAHRIRVTVTSLLAAALILWLTIYGAGYYSLGLAERAESPLHPILRPSGAIGVRLGMAGFALFLLLALYPLRKRWRWLASIGKTSHWLDYHVIAGITAPILITFHSSFKMGGLAGLAYWIMVAVAVSGFIGRYLYAQIPRTLNTTQLDMSDLETQARDLAAELDRQSVLPAEAMAPLLRVPARAQVRSMSLLALLWTMLRMDFERPLLVSRLRRRTLSGWQKLLSLGGLLSSGQPELETVISSVRRLSWLAMKMAFLDRVRQAFHLWHVVHRPFSISFAVLVAVHIGVVVMMGYY
ncbi:MAG: hypothetical protein U0Q16_26175 [Bryobacteraceae bacterium]